MEEVGGGVGGFAVVVEAVGGFDQVDDAVGVSGQDVLDLGAGDDGEGGDGAGVGWVGVGGVEGGHGVVTSMVGEQSASGVGLARPTRTSRVPVKGSLLCAVRMLSTRRRSPLCQGSRAVWVV